MAILEMLSAGEDDDPRIIRARNKVRRIYNSLIGKGGWRAVAMQLGLPNVFYVVSFAVHGVIPGNLDYRTRMFIPKRLGLVRKVRERQVQPDYINWWSHLSKEERHAIIKSHYEMRKQVTHDR